MLSGESLLPIYCGKQKSHILTRNQLCHSMNGNAGGIRDSVVFLNDDIFISLYLWKCKNCELRMIRFPDIFCKASL